MGEGRHTGKGRRILNAVLFFLLASMAVSVILYLVVASLFSTKEEKRMIQENELIRAEYDGMERDVERLENVVDGLKDRDREIYHNIFEAYPPSLSVSGADTSFSYDADSVVTFGYARRAAARMNAIEESEHLCEERYGNIMKVLASGNVIVTAIPSIIPVAGFTPEKAGASTGMKMHPLYKTLRQHNGMDIVVHEMSDVFVTADGVVAQVSRSQVKEGNAITVDHGNGYITRYTHLGTVFVRKGQRVRQGSRIALVGNSGNSFAPHLHYEVIFRDRYLEPTHFFFADQTPQEYRRTMLVALNNGQSMD